MTTDLFAPFETDYKTLRSGAGFVVLADWTCVSIAGRDRQQFLHNFCTNDIKRLAPGASCEVLITNVKGKIVGHGVVSCRDDELVFVGAPGQGVSLVAHLDRYVIREDVTVRDETDCRSYLLVHREAIESGYPIIDWNLIGDDSYILVEVPSADVEELTIRLTSRGAKSVGGDAFTAARIEGGFPFFGVDFDDNNLPQEVGRDRQAISFTKGCYLGQETVARIDALGHVNQQLVGVRFIASATPTAGLELSRAGSPAGRVKSASFSPKLNAPLALAMVRREANAVGSRLESEVGECEVIALPVAND
jgi:tRNA-modifying protein YgfZ